MSHKSKVHKNNFQTSGTKSSKSSLNGGYGKDGKRIKFLRYSKCSSPRKRKMITSTYLYGLRHEIWQKYYKNIKNFVFTY